LTVPKLLPPGRLHPNTWFRARVQWIIACKYIIAYILILIFVWICIIYII
jgi:hypothetical protein